MRKLCALLVFLLTCVLLKAQTGQIRGKVLDSKTLEPLPFANIFVDNTTIGVAANANGDYVLKNIPTGDQDIIFSYVGYGSYQIRITIREGDVPLTMVIKLVPEERQLENIQVTGTRDKEWEKQLGKFRKIFLGTDKVAASCKILNPWVLEFSETSGPQGESFVTSASQPLEIENFTLGYKVFFYLKSFQANAKSYSILGNYRFEEMPTPDARLALKWTQNRREVYSGSDRHLFKAMVEGNVKDEGFLLYTDKPGSESVVFRSPLFANELNKTVVRFPDVSIVTPGSKPGEFKITLKGRLEVHYANATITNVAKRTYRDVPYPVSWLEANGGVLMVTRTGVVINSVDLVRSGAMSAARVGNMLPLDYQPDQTAKIVPEEKPNLSVDEQRWQRWYEQVYVFTDKPYYYPGETIWMKGFMNYNEPTMRDTLSRMLHVELVKPTNKVVIGRLLRIDSGFAAGYIQLPDTLAPGKYFLRAYTEWMRNYGKERLFVSEVPVLQLRDQVEKVDPLVDTLHHVSVVGAKPVYKAREKVEFTIKVTDENDDPINAQLAVSVTDAGQVVPVRRDRSVIQNFNVPDSMSYKGLTIKSFMEFGITTHGKFVGPKKGITEAEVTAVQGRFDDYTTVKTDKEGNFVLNGFQFYDSARIGFQAKDEKGKKVGSVKIVPVDPPEFFYDGAGVDMKVRRTENPQRVMGDFQLPKGSKLLQEVVIQGQRLDDPRNVKVYGKADYTLEGDRLAELSANTNLLAGLQGKIPGLTVTWYWDENGIQHYKVRIRGGTSSMVGSTDPLVLLDGVPFGGDDAGLAVSQISPGAVRKVEVITHANPVFGVRGTNGVLAIYTKAGGYGGKEVPDEDLKSFDFYRVDGYQSPASFQSPDYDSKDYDASKADFRSTIYWDPSVAVKESGEAGVYFFAADLPGLYRIVAEGVTGEGKPVRGEAYIEIISRD